VELPSAETPSAVEGSERPMVDPERLELPTSAFEAHCSIQLSYGSAPAKYTCFFYPLTPSPAALSRKTASFVPYLSGSASCQGRRFL
jgi:hypothetical protein